MRRKRSAFRLPVAGKAGASLLLVSLAFMADAQPVDGKLLFDGSLALTARLRGDPQVLPAFATACMNCHEASRARGSIRDLVAPPLDARLTHELSRRRGPPSAYTPGGFCDTLRTGVDAAGVMVNRAMPQYEVTDDQCDALWQHITSRPPSTAPLR